MTREEELVKNVQFVESALCAACQKAGRNPQDVSLMAVTKYAQDKDVLTLLDSGLIRHIGESRVQQAEKRWTSSVFAKYKTVKHFIGHLQKNKAAKAARLFDFIDSLDSEETALALNRTAPEGKIIRALIQIKLTQKDTPLDSEETACPFPLPVPIFLRRHKLHSLRLCRFAVRAAQPIQSPFLATSFTHFASFGSLTPGATNAR